MADLAMKDAGHDCCSWLAASISHPNYCLTYLKRQSTIITLPAEHTRGPRRRRAAGTRVSVARVFAYGAGAYVSIPNFGLVARASIPTTIQERDFLIQAVPFAAFVVSSVLLYFA